MGVRISDKSNVCLYCSTEGVSFGPVFTDTDEAQRFLDWVAQTDGRDPREIPGGTLIRWYADWNGGGE